MAKRLVFEATPMRRLSAFIIDMIILWFVVGVPFSSLFESLAPSRMMVITQESLATFKIQFVSLVLFLFFFLYFTILEYYLGQTPGKMITKTVQEHNGFLSCVMANLFLIPIFPFIILWFIDPIAIVLKNKTLSNILSKTRLLHVDKEIKIFDNLDIGDVNG
ncbi:RDD family protein [Candidatus Woesearchaeota archaeon]|nr:RDD family protein [Candidatus Woesearchaeota archaeon]